MIVGTSVPHVSRLHDDASESCCAMRYPMISSWDLIKPSDESLTLNNIMVRSSEDLSSGRFAARFRSGSWPLRGPFRASTTMVSKPFLGQIFYAYARPIFETQRAPASTSETNRGQKRGKKGEEEGVLSLLVVFVVSSLRRASRRAGELSAAEQER